MLDSSEASISRLHICFLVQYAPVFFQGSRIRFFQRSFVEPSDFEVDFVYALIEAATGLTAQTNHFKATNFLLKNYRLSFFLFVMFGTTSARKKLLLESAATVLLQSFILMLFQTSLTSGLMQSSNESWATAR